MTAFTKPWLWLFLVTQVAFAMKLYDYYIPDGVVTSGLMAEGQVFKLNGKDLRILSGAFHYFRVHPHYWRDTFRKIRAAGLNTVETYVPWNLHEPRQGVYDFGDLGEDMSFLLDVRAFIQMAQEEDLFVIFRPGPYICSEWDFGGLPSWLLRDYTMQVRSYYDNFRAAAAKFFNALMPQVVDLQFTKGGPIIMVQVENEFGAFGYDDFPRDTLYLEFLKENLMGNGMGESLLFTSDGVLGSQDLGSLPGVFMAANFQNKVEENLAMLKTLQPDRPALVAEFWTGWYDNWLLDHHRGWDHEEFEANLESILQHNVSVNLYMFIGGTNWGFMAGADGVEDLPGSTGTIPHYAPDTSSYVSNPDAPEIREKTAYPSVSIKEAIDFSSILSSIKDTFKSSSGPISMEDLPCNDENGQSYGYLTYCTKLPRKAGNYSLKIKGHIRDMAQIIVDGSVITQPYNKDGDGDKAAGFWGARDAEFLLPKSSNEAEGDLVIIVENMGRVNYGQPHNFKQSKGLVEGPILLDEAPITNWTMIPLEFKKSFITSLTDWNSYAGSLTTPGLYRGTLNVTAEPLDTFVDMSSWNKGVVFINGFNLGRYWSEGPQKTMYLAAPF